MVTLKVKKSRDKLRDNFLKILEKLRDAWTLNDNFYPLYLELSVCRPARMCFYNSKTKVYVNCKATNSLATLPKVSNDKMLTFELHVVSFKRDGRKSFRVWHLLILLRFSETCPMNYPLISSFSGFGSHIFQRSGLLTPTCPLLRLPSRTSTVELLLIQWTDNISEFAKNIFNAMNSQSIHIINIGGIAPRNLAWRERWHDSCIFCSVSIFGENAA